MDMRERESEEAEWVSVAINFLWLVFERAGRNEEWVGGHLWELYIYFFFLKRSYLYYLTLPGLLFWYNGKSFACPTHK